MALATIALIIGFTLIAWKLGAKTGFGDIVASIDKIVEEENNQRDITPR